MKQCARTDLPVWTGKSQAAAAAVLNVHEDTVGAAKAVLKFGTPEEVKAVEDGKASVSTLANQIRDWRYVGRRWPICRAVCGAGVHVTIAGDQHGPGERCDPLTTSA
jgi:hypothetical protein